MIAGYFVRVSVAWRGPRLNPMLPRGRGAALNLAGVVRMFDWFKSERRERRKKVRQDRKQLEVRARRFLKSYLEADEVRKPEFYRAVEDISGKCRPPDLVLPNQI